ncbi:uncharacterized protein LOC129894677 [Solanum dulcamara]|uniref:uncharacterized protein LOC129894677 n=1 Tax=Solanum dulcamara TaxID=45834 RepID=UPI0024856FDD|nr:uncharacterized protein LOC129894677 [Solanum dulcamara]
MLHKCAGDPSRIFPVDDIQVTEELSYEELPMAVLDRQVKRLHTKDVASIKSPWDVITFPNEDPSHFQPSPPSSFAHQFDGYVVNETFNDSNETVMSNNVTKDVDVDVFVAVEKIKQDKDKDIEMEDLGLLMYQTNNDNKKKEKQHEVVMAEMKSTRRHPTYAEKSSYSSFDPCEFYYYSGFGPLWGKKGVQAGRLIILQQVSKETIQPKMLNNVHLSKWIMKNLTMLNLQTRMIIMKKKMGRRRRGDPGSIKARSIRSIM